MNFGNPMALLLLLLVPLMAIYFWTRRKHISPSFKYSSLAVVAKTSRGVRARLVMLPKILFLFSFVCVVIALARPRTSETLVKRNVEGVDIVVTLDISASMLIEDMTPNNRLEAAKNTIKEFVNGRVSDRIGLVVFSGESYTRIPPTLDYLLLLESLKEVKTENIKMGTAIGVALANAVARLKNSTATSRIVILLTDGESNTGTISPETALEIAKGYDIRVYTIGLGQDGQARLPVYRVDPLGRRQKSYQPIHSKINDALLEKLATETGGKYYRAIKTKSLQGVFREIDQLEKSKIDEQRFTKYDEHYQSILHWGLLALVFSILLGRSILGGRP